MAWDSSTSINTTEAEEAPPFVSIDGFDKEPANDFLEALLPVPRKVRAKEAERWKSLETRSDEDEEDEDDEDDEDSFLVWRRRGRVWCSPADEKADVAGRLATDTLRFFFGVLIDMASSC
jgi:hypothetical protein